MPKTPSRNSKGSNGDSGGDPPVEEENEQPKNPSPPATRTRKKRTRAQQTENQDSTGVDNDSAVDEQKKKKPRFNSPDKVTNDKNVDDNEEMEAEDDAKESALLPNKDNEEMEDNDESVDDNEMKETEYNDNEQKPAAKPSDNDAAVEPVVEQQEQLQQPKKTRRMSARAASRFAAGGSAIQMSSAAAAVAEEDEDTMRMPPAQQILASAKAGGQITAQEMSEQVAVDANGTGNEAVQGEGETEAGENEMEEEEEELEEEEESGQLQECLARPMIWWLFILLLQLLCWPFMLNPVLPAFFDTADAALGFYQNTISSSKPVNQTYLDELANAAIERKEKQSELIADLLKAKTALDADVVPLLAQHTYLKETFDFVLGNINQRKTPLIELDAKLSSLGDLMAKSNDTLSSELLSKLRAALSKYDKKKLLDLTGVDLWEIPEVPESCGDEDDEDGDSLKDAEKDDGEDDKGLAEVVQLDELQETLRDLDYMVNASANDIIDSADSLKKVQLWIREKLDKSTSWEVALDELLEKGSPSVVKEKGPSSALGSSTGSLANDKILRRIQDRFELEMADQTGIFDFASVRNGARVIRSGPRATSLSFSQTLPYLNRAMAMAGLRFYGYDAEAALTPTDPPNALGQCWSFRGDKASVSNQDSSRGFYATLTFRVAKPVKVNSVAIEHPPAEVTDTMDSAIRVFRVIGYEDSVARKAAYELGRFEYKVDGFANPTRQEFEVKSEGIPELRSITIAIESTWGQNYGYGCLYRVRVHGDNDDQD